MLVDAVSAAVQNNKFDAQVIEQGNIVNQASEVVRLNDFIGDKNDKSFFTVCLDIGRGASKPLDKVLIAAH